MPDSKFTRAIQAGISSFMQGRQMFDQLETSALQREYHQAQMANIRTPEQEAQQRYDTAVKVSDYERGKAKEDRATAATEAGTASKLQYERNLVRIGALYGIREDGTPNVPEGTFINTNGELERGFDPYHPTPTPKPTPEPKIGDIKKLSDMIDLWGGDVPVSAGVRSVAMQYLQEGKYGEAQAVVQASVYPTENTLGSNVPFEVEQQARGAIAQMMLQGASNAQIDQMLQQMRKEAQGSGAIPQGRDYLKYLEAGWDKAKPYILGPDREPKPETALDKERSGLIEFGQFGTPFVRRRKE